MTVHKLLARRTLWLILTLVLTLVWISPSGVSLLPVGGDATRFGLGLMSELGRSAHETRPPLWNALWGYGFPALAESQIGAFYPPHLILYGLLPLEWAYAADRIVHALWAALGCWVLANVLGRSAAASFLGSVVFVFSGFFLVHETHHWGWPTTSWLPWIWWAMLQVVRSDRQANSGLLSRCALLSLCASMPVLTGHFQMGFVSLVTGFVFAAGITMSERRMEPEDRKSTSTCAKKLVALVAGSAVAAILAAIQVIPTYELAKLANDQRDWEYLSGFAAPPVHWLGLILPGLGRGFPFWRPLLWDQFHTSPEELFFYVGLVPIWLAVFGVTRTWRSDPATRALAATLAISLLLAAGPYGFGFSLAIRLPGFSYFRAPARWTAAATLALAMLAARGSDTAMTNQEVPARSLRRFFLLTLVLASVSVAGLEGLIRLAENSRGEPNPILDKVDVVRRQTMPGWNDVGSWQDWVRRSAATPAAPIPAYVKPYTNLDRQRFSTDRTEAYAKEVVPQLLLICTGLAGSFAIRASKRRMVALLFALMAADGAIQAKYRPIEFAPVKSVKDQSPVLARIGELSRKRSWPLAIAGDLGNLPMAAGGSPIRAYRTLDVPVMPALDPVYSNPIEALNRKSARLAGLGYVLIDPPTWRNLRAQWRPEAEIEEIEDPELWSWLTTSQVAQRGNSTFALVHLPGELGRAWRVAQRDLDALGVSEFSDATRPDRLEAIAATAVPLEVERARPERIAIESRTEGPELWIVSQWADPNWRATLSNGSGEGSPVEILPMHGGWQGVRIPSAGQWKLAMRYEPASFYAGAAISAAGWLALAMVLAWGQLRGRPSAPIAPAMN